jgi:branched-chain amino acid transport system ATP-binding protein
VGIIGPNGAGKTTLFDVVSGITPLDVGRVELAGLDISRLSFDRRARLGLGRSFQNVRLFPSLTVRECVMVALERHLALRSAALAAVWAPALRRSERRAARRVERLLDVLGLASSAEKFVSELSTGTRRAVDIACVMAAEPRVLLLDEPSSGLAQAETEQLGPLVTSLVRDTGCAVLIIEHDVPLVSSISDHMVAMDLGAVLASGTPTEVVNDARVVEAYLAASPDVVARSDALAAALASSRTPGFTGPPTEEEP